MSSEEDEMDDKELIEALCDIEEGLSPWEVEFVDSLHKWLKIHPKLTARQRRKAEEIWEDKG